jgi:hypothetical protein
VGSDGVTYIPSIKKIGASVESILRFYLSSWKGYSVDITAGRDL